MPSFGNNCCSGPRLHNWAPKEGSASSSVCYSFTDAPRWANDSGLFLASVRSARSKELLSAALAWNPAWMQLWGWFAPNLMIVNHTLAWLTSCSWAECWSLSEVFWCIRRKFRCIRFWAIAMLFSTWFGLPDPDSDLMPPVLKRQVAVKV